MHKISSDTVYKSMSKHLGCYYDGRTVWLNFRFHFIPEAVVEMAVHIFHQKNNPNPNATLAP